MYSKLYLEQANHMPQNRHAWEQETYSGKKNKEIDHFEWCKAFVCLVSVRPLLYIMAILYHLYAKLQRDYWDPFMSHESVIVASVLDAMCYSSYILTQK